MRGAGGDGGRRGAPGGGGVRRQGEGVAPGVAPGARVSPQAEAAAETLLGRGLLGLQRLHLPQQRRGLQVHDVRREEGHLHTVGRRQAEAFLGGLPPPRGVRGRGRAAVTGIGCREEEGGEPLGGFPPPRGVREGGRAGGRDRNRVTFTGINTPHTPRSSARGSPVNVTQARLCV